MHCAGAENNIDIGEALFNSFGNLGPLHHTAAEGNHQFGALPLDVLQSADVAEYTILGAFAYRTGVEQDKIGILGGIGKAEPHFGKQPFEMLSVRNVLLAAEAVDKSQRRVVVACRRQGRRPLELEPVHLLLQLGQIVDDHGFLL